MIAALGVLGLLACFVAATFFWIVSLAPRLGPSALRYSTPKRLALAAAGLGASTLTALIGESAWAWVAVGLGAFFASAIFVVQPRNVFASLERTDHVPGGRAELSGDVDVFGLELDGHALAWPILGMLAPRHIVNDQVGGKAVVASYCPACRSGMVFSSTVGGRALTFAVAGLWRKNMVAVDRETHTLWQQATGEGLAGPLRHEQLDILFGEQTTWAAWRAAHPDTELAIAPRDARNGIVPERLFNRLVMEATKTVVLPGLGRPDPRLPPHDEVVGLKIGESFRAYPLKAVETAGELRDTDGSSEIVLTWDPGGGGIHATVDGARVHVQRHWWLAWSEFHPDTTLWGAPAAD